MRHFSIPRTQSGNLFPRSDAEVRVQLTSETLSLRNVVALGPTTLRANFCSGLLHLARITPGMLDKPSFVC